jgi:hypothetical protein
MSARLGFHWRQQIADSEQLAPNNYAPNQRQVLLQVLPELRGVPADRVLGFEKLQPTKPNRSNTPVLL